MFEHFEIATEPETREELFAAVKGSATAKVAALKALVDSGEVSRTGDGKKTSPYRYSRLPVPTIYGEQENENPKIVEKAHDVRPDSCSRDFQSHSYAGASEAAYCSPASSHLSLTSMRRTPRG
jgi:hypothetical protein